MSDLAAEPAGRQAPPSSSGAEAEGELRLFVVAGEPSGDALAGPLVAALRRRLGARLQLRGIGGDCLAEQGLRSLFPMSDLSVMGLLEVVPRIPRLLRRLRQAEAAVRAWRPHAVLTVDAPGFNFRLARRLAGDGFPLVHYVAPTVWAWRPGRARRIAPLFTHLLALLPFEPPWFRKWGLATTYVGHPALESITRRPAIGERPTGGAPVLCLLPGSRRGELRRHLPIFGATVERLRRRHPTLETVLPTIPELAGEVRNAVAGWPHPPAIVEGRAAGLAAMAGADIALGASGTVTLELALSGTPFVACYRANPLTAAVVRRLLRVPHVTLANLVLERAAVPELLQERCRPDLLATELDRLLGEPAARAAQCEAFAELERRLAVDMAPSERAASVVAGVLLEAEAARERGAGA